MNYDLRIQLGRDTLCGVYSNDRFVREAAGRRERGAELRSERLITLRADWKIVYASALSPPPPQGHTEARD